MAIRLEKGEITMSEKKKLLLSAAIAFLLSALGACSSSASLGSEHLKDFHTRYMEQAKDELSPNALHLYVDNSYCIAQGQHSSFYKELVPVLTRRCQEYYSIKGANIVQEDLTAEDAYKRLLSIEDVPYAAIKEAAERIVRGNSEAVLMTDCEYYEQTIARGNTNNAYLEGVFATWLERGHDIYIIAEPYTETTAKGNFAKKRFYIVFTSDKLEHNIYAELSKNVNLNREGVKTLHLSATPPMIVETQSKPEPTLAAQVSSYGRYEVQDWQIDWSSIQSILMQETDLDGQPNANGQAVITGLAFNSREGDLLRIDDVRIRVLPLNTVYSDFVQSLEPASGVSAPQVHTIQALPEAPNFMLLDEKLWKSKRQIALYLDRQNFDPTILDNSAAGANFFRIDILADKVSNITNSDDKIREILVFDDISGGGQNVSLYESVKICLNRPKIQNLLKEQVLYSIYVSTLAY